MTADTDVGVQVGASLDLLLGKVGELVDKIDRREQRMQQLWQDVHPVPILPGAIPLVAGAGTLANFQDTCGPHDPYWWDVTRLTAYGFTVGTVTAFLNDPNGEQIASTTVPGQFTWSGNLLLGPRDHLVFTATGVTGNVLIAGQAIEVASWILPEYIL